jgi:16S rRNA (adenine1518-N6/adenine1519-N6)-dimethyltransferase
MTTPKILLNSRSLVPRRRLGQNFLANPAIAAAIVERSRLGPQDAVVEIGPGLGALTIPLARAAHRVYAIEMDAELIEVLHGELSANGVSNVMIRHADALEEDFAAFASGGGRRLVVFGNLPYNISSQVVVKLVASRAHVSRAVLMFQRELARRLTAAPGGRDYGRITALLGYCADVRSLLRVGAGNFHPVPQVDSEVLEIDFTVDRRHPPHDEKLFFQVLAAAFGQRRKNLKNALTAGLRINPEDAARALVQAGIDPARRAETLAPADFVAIAVSFMNSEGGRRNSE